jgi:anti-sigma regulatory factor (Ser/Thr protein kinase)
VSQPDIVLDLRSDPRLLCSVRALVRRYVMDLGLTESRALEVVLAVDEACANAMRHSYGGCCDKRLRLALSTTAKWIRVELRDEGKPAAPERIKKKKGATGGALRPGGLGVPLIRKVFDDVRYEPGEVTGNRVLMRLKRPEAHRLRDPEGS